MLLGSFFFFFNDTATTEIYTLSLHDALPICHCICGLLQNALQLCAVALISHSNQCWRDRKSTRLNSSHSQISYAVFCLKKKKSRLNLPTPPPASISPQRTSVRALPP